MVIVCDGPIDADPVFNLDVPTRALVSCFYASNAFFSLPRKIIGKKGTWVAVILPGDLIAIWDDDDFSAPERLDFQVQSLQISQQGGYRVPGLKFTDNSSWWQYRAGNGFVVGSSLCFRRDWWAAHPFPEIQIGEDVQFCDVAHSAGELAMCPDMDLMYATIHKGNTSFRRPELHSHNYTALPGYEWPTLSTVG